MGYVFTAKRGLVKTKDDSYVLVKADEELPKDLAAGELDRLKRAGAVVDAKAAAEAAG